MSETALQKATIPFDGRVQSGVEQPPQAHLEVLGMNLEPSLDQAAFIELLKDLTATARELTQGNPIPSSGNGCGHRQPNHYLRFWGTDF